MDLAEVSLEALAVLIINLNLLLKFYFSNWQGGFVFYPIEREARLDARDAGYPG